MNKLLSYLTPVLLVVILVVLLLGGGGTAIGGDTNYDSVDVTDGYMVDGTIVIDGDGNIDGVITSTTGTFSSTLGVSGLFTASGGITATAGINIDGGALRWGSSSSTLSEASGGFSITAANVCDEGTLNVEPIANTSTTLPAAADLIADCMATVGDTRQILLRNTSSGTSTPIVSGGTYATSTDLYSASGTEALAPSAKGKILFETVSGTAVEAFLDNYE